jgi:predicted RecA/RadA family phage recombinase
MSNNFVQPGKVITVPAPANVVSGEGVLVGNIFGVASHDALQGAQLELETEGVWALDKVAAETWSFGQAIYWNAGAKKATEEAGDNRLIGVALYTHSGEAGGTLAVAGQGATAGTVRLNGVFGLASQDEVDDIQGGST